MDSKNYTQVLIDGKIYTLGGSEDEGYLQRAASYVNEKVNTLRRIPGFTKQSVEYQTVMAELNMADDYFKAMEHSREVEHQRDELERETYSLKHELVSTQMKLEVVLKDLEERQRELEELMAELDGLCGLDKVKADVKSLINLVKVRRLRQEHGLPVPPMSLHLVFLGNPGTGKTTVARLLAKIYRAIGVLSKGQLVEVDRSGLVAGFVGQTALKTGEVIEKALGGVLFIDEAYALANQDAPNDFGREAIETLLKGMEDHRDDLIVIAAGYTELMGRFLHANPGLESRFNKYFYFEDYNGAQLLAIFQSMCAKNGYTLDDKATEYAESYFKTLYEERDENFGNARDVRNVFERAVARQSDRVAALEKPGKEELMALTVADLQEEGGPVPDGAPDETLPESP